MTGKSGSEMGAIAEVGRFGTGNLSNSIKPDAFFEDWMIYRGEGEFGKR